MATAPSKRWSGASVFNSNANAKTITGAAWQPGDILVALSADANRNATVITVTSSPAETWTRRSASGGGTNADTFVTTDTDTADGTTATGTITSTRSGGGTSFTGAVAVALSGASGVGNAAATPGAGSAAATVSFTTAGDNSSVLIILADWSASDSSTRVWATVNGYTPTAGNGGELVYHRDTSEWAAAAALYPDVGPAGTYTFGLTTEGGADWSYAIVEVKGTAGSVDPGWGYYLLEDGSGVLLLEDGSALLRDTAATGP